MLHRRFAKILKDHLNEAQGCLRQRLILAINQAQSAHHRLRAQRDGAQLTGRDFLTAVRGRQKRQPQAGHSKALHHFGGIELHRYLNAIFDRLQPRIQTGARGTGFRQEQWKRHQVVAGDGTHLRNRVFGGRDHADLVAIDVRHLHPLFLDRQLRETEVRGVVHDGLHHARTVGAVYLQLHAGKLLLIFREDLRKNVNARGFVGRDDQFAARIALELVDLILRTAPQIEDLLGVTGKNLPRRGQRNAATEALEQLGFQLLLELPDLGADGRLRAVARLRGFGKTLQPNDLEERVELIKIHRPGVLFPLRQRSSSGPRSGYDGTYCNRRSPLKLAPGSVSINVPVKDVQFDEISGTTRPSRYRCGCRCQGSRGLTSGFSQKCENLWAALCSYFAWHNFRRIHQTLRPLRRFTGIASTV